MAQSEAGLAERVKAALTDQGHFDLQRVDIGVHVHDGVVKLTGMVDTVGEKRRAEGLARGVAGMQRFESDLRVSPVMERTDAEVIEKVRAALEEDRSIDETSIQVEACDGVVRLAGLVGTCAQRRLAVATVWWLVGVQDVRDDLQVMYPGEEGDDDLQETCHVLMEKDPLVDATQISVLSKSGVVTLVGAVSSEVERDSAENSVWGIEGVVDVQNQLVVVQGALPFTLDSGR